MIRRDQIHLSHEKRYTRAVPCTPFLATIPNSILPGPTERLHVLYLLEPPALPRDLHFGKNTEIFPR